MSDRPRMTTPGPHPPCAMRYSHKASRRHQYALPFGHIRYINKSFSVYKCPECGMLADHKRTPIICKGEGWDGK